MSIFQKRKCLIGLLRFAFHWNTFMAGRCFIETSKPQIFSWQETTRWNLVISEFQECWKVLQHMQWQLWERPTIWGNQCITIVLRSARVNLIHIILMCGLWAVCCMSYALWNMLFLLTICLDSSIKLFKVNMSLFLMCTRRSWTVSYSGFWIRMKIRGLLLLMF